MPQPTQPTANPSTNTPKNPSTGAWKEGSPETNQVPKRSNDSSQPKKAGQFPQDNEISQKQEGEWKQPGQDEFPGVENAPRTDREDGPAETEDNSRRYI